MYRYQPSPTEYGSSTWACHQSCGDYTHWRVVESNVSNIPPHEIPERWPGFENQRLQVAREAYAKKMKDTGNPKSAKNSNPEVKKENDGGKCNLF